MFAVLLLDGCTGIVQAVTGLETMQLANSAFRLRPAGWLVKQLQLTQHKHEEGGNEASLYFFIHPGTVLSPGERRSVK